MDSTAQTVTPVLPAIRLRESADGTWHAGMPPHPYLGRGKTPERALGMLVRKLALAGLVQVEATPHKRVAEPWPFDIGS